MVRLDTGVLTISGTGLGSNLQVAVDGQPVPQLPGATDTQVEVLAPASVLTMPGTVGDRFVISSPAGSLLASGIAAPTGRAGSAASDTSGWAALDATAGSSSAAGPAPAEISPFLIENPALQNTSVGLLALASNTTGTSNTASGYTALQPNTSGTGNTASGRGALQINDTGNDNTASGYLALTANTTGANNTAGGVQALVSNTVGVNNTAVGLNALFSNTIGTNNTAAGVSALTALTTGHRNVAVGAGAGTAATSGS